MLEPPDTADSPRFGSTGLGVQPCFEDGDELAPEAVKRLKILEADSDLVHGLMMAEYRGREWEAFATVLASYGVPIIASWIRTNKIVQKCREKGLPCPAIESRSRTREDVDDIAADVVVDAIQKFRDLVLQPRRWDPGKGASLRTFFIGQCLLQFPNAYRRVMKVRLPDLVALELVDLACGHHPTPVDGLAELARCASLPPESTARMAAAQAMGYSREEIAENLGRSPRSVSSAIFRHRRRLKGGSVR